MVKRSSQAQAPVCRGMRHGRATATPPKHDSEKKIQLNGNNKRAERIDATEKDVKIPRVQEESAVTIIQCKGEAGATKLL